MAHLEINRLVDCTRGVGSDVERTDMSDHLASGCSRCGRFVTAFERVLAASAATRSGEPPDYAVRSIKAYFGLHQPDSASAWKKIRLASGFDSELVPAPSGMRGHDQAVRHISYESGQYLVDLVIEKPESAPEGLVAGQLLRQLGGPIIPLPEIPAFLLSRGELLATALTSDQGGFSLAGGLRGECELWFFLEDERVIGVTWDQNSTTATEH